MVLKMSNDKSLVITHSANAYEGENNAENIKILLPIYINDYDIRDCSVYLNIVNQDGVGDIIDISSDLTKYNDSLYQYDLLMSNVFTYKAGKIQLWIKIIEASQEIILKSDSVYCTIKPHIEIEEFIPEQQLTLIEDLTIKINNLLTEVQAVKDRINDISNYTLLAVNTDTIES